MPGTDDLRTEIQDSFYTRFSLTNILHQQRLHKSAPTSPQQVPDNSHTRLVEKKRNRAFGVPWRPDNRPVQTHLLQDRLFVRRKIHMCSLELDDPKQLQRPIFKRRSLSHHFSIETPCARSLYHDRPS